MIVSLDEAKTELKIDHSEEDTIIIRLINTAEQFINSAVDGEIYLQSDKVKTIALFLIADMYENRQFTDEKGNTKIREVAKMMLLQL